jgi:hypothetical protein
MNGWDKGTVAKVIGIALSLVIALLSVFGYDVVIVRPQVEGLTRQVRSLEVELRGAQVAPLDAPAGSAGE